MNNQMTLETLRQMQSWTLDQKIAHSIDKVSSFISVIGESGKKPYISFSGGKDSTVMQDLIRRFLDKEHQISMVFCNTGNEYPEIIRFVRSVPGVRIIRPELPVKEVLAKYGFPLVSKEQSHSIRQVKTTNSEKLKAVRLYGKDPKNGLTAGKISERWKFLIDEPFMVSERCCEFIKKRPFARYEKRSGELPIIGTMADESRIRTNQWVQRGGCNSFEEKHTACYPMSIWTDHDVWEYIRRFKIPYSEIYDKGAVRTGCMVCGFGAHLEKTSRFTILYELYPKAYNHLLAYQNNGVTYREALRKIGVKLPDEKQQLELFDGKL